LIPMVVANDERRYVAANSAACLLLRSPEENILRLRVDDLTPLENRSLVDTLWADFIRQGVQEGTFALMMPDGAQLEVDYSARANVEPGLHLSILMFPPGASRERLKASGSPDTVLTNRECEVLGMVAMGRGTSWIANELGISSTTVETHVRHCLEKLGARNRTHAIALGLQTGEISLDLGTAHPRYWG
jgi:DNA-binding CsgD family transcriptional regulator